MGKGILRFNLTATGHIRLTSHHKNPELFLIWNNSRLLLYHRKIARSLVGLGKPFQYQEEK
jgi:hypothetical protein